MARVFAVRWEWWKRAWQRQSAARQAAEARREIEDESASMRIEVSGEGQVQGEVPASPPPRPDTPPCRGVAAGFASMATHAHKRESQQQQSAFAHRVRHITRLVIARLVQVRV